MINGLVKFVKKASIIMIEDNNCSLFDGGCHTLAHSINSVIKDTTIYHISRDSNRRDHSVVYFNKLDKYLDGDGFQTEAELFRKMSKVELVNCKVLLPFNDFTIERVFIHTHLKFSRMIKSYVNKEF